MLIKHTAADMEERLSVIIGSKLRHIRGTDSMLNVGFGEDMTHVNIDGDSIIVAEHRLQVACYWKLTSEDRIELGYRDFYSPKDGFDEDEFFALKDISGLNRFDDRLDSVMEEIAGKIQVESVSASKYGDLTIKFDKGYALEIFADTSLWNVNLWRFFSFSSFDDMFVVFEDDEKNYEE